MRDTRASSAGAYRNRNGHHYAPRRNSGSGLIGGLKKALITLVAIPANIIIFLTKPPGNAIIHSIFVVYFVGISTENYWQTLGNFPSFMPKPGIPDNPDLRVLFGAIRTTSFWGAALIAILIGGLQAYALREMDVETAKTRYEAVAGYEVPDENPKSLDIAEERRKQYQTVGMRTLRMKGILIVGSYLVDVVTSYNSYPLLGVWVGRFFVHLAWNILSVIGTESSVNMFLDSIESLKKQPKVEVMPD